jgi:LysR family glycine cleavage system transcriptional activator
LRAFEAAARHLSFKKAADELSVTPTAISHQIKGLEAYLGLALFRRLTRALELTPEGQAMVPKISEGLACFIAAVERTRSQFSSGRLIITAPPSFATRWLIPRLHGFTDAEPNVKLHLASSLAAIDSDELVEQGLMTDLDSRLADSHIFIRFGTGSYPGFHCDRIFAPDYIAVCSPKLLNSKLPLEKPADVRFHLLLHDDTITNERARPSWEEWLRLAGVNGVDLNAGPHFSDSGLALAAAIDGLGLALVSVPLVSAELGDGRLIAPFEISVGQRYAYYLVIPEAMTERPDVAAFRTWLLALIAAEEAALGPG